MPTTSYTNWDFHNYHVTQDVNSGQFVNAASTLVGAGPPTVTSGATTSNVEVYPIGMLESVGLQQNRQLQQIFEIGSNRSYFVPGRTIGAISVGRTFYFGPSLLKVLYAYYRTPAGSAIPIGTAAAGATKSVGSGANAAAVPDPAAALLNNPTTGVGLHRSPGEDFFFIDLASDLFAQPTGLAIYFKDQSKNTVGAFYLENAYVQGHQMSISSGSVLIMEGVSMMYDKIQPIKVIV